MLVPILFFSAAIQMFEPGEMFPAGQVQPLLRQMLIDDLGLHMVRKGMVKRAFARDAQPAHVVIIGLGETDEFMTPESLDSGSFNVTAFEPLVKFVNLWDEKTHVKAATARGLYRRYNVGVGEVAAASQLAHYGGHGQQMIRYEPMTAHLAGTAIDFLSLDTQGHELETLRGAGSLLSQGLIKMIMVEICFPDVEEPNILAMLKLLDQAGYIMFDTTWHLFPYAGRVGGDIWTFNPSATMEDPALEVSTELHKWVAALGERFKSNSIVQVDLLCIHRSHVTATVLSTLLNLRALSKRGELSVLDTMIPQILHRERSREVALKGWAGLPANMKFEPGHYLRSNFGTARFSLSADGKIIELWKSTAGQHHSLQTMSIEQGISTSSSSSKIRAAAYLMLSKKCALRAYSEDGTHTRLLPAQKTSLFATAAIQETCVLILQDEPPRSNDAPELCAYRVKNVGNPNHGSRIPWKAVWCLDLKRHPVRRA